MFKIKRFFFLLRFLLFLLTIVIDETLGFLWILIWLPCRIWHNSIKLLLVIRKKESPLKCNYDGNTESSTTFHFSIRIKSPRIVCVEFRTKCLQLLNYRSVVDSNALHKNMRTSIDFSVKDDHVKGSYVITASCCFKGARAKKSLFSTEI